MIYTLLKKDSFKVKAAKENIDASKYKKCMSNYEVSLKLLDNYYEALRYKNQIRYYEILKLIYQKLLYLSKKKDYLVLERLIN
jgi:outer membrane protein